MGNLDGREKRLLENAELDQELSACVTNNRLPSIIADKLGKKLKEKNVKITREQLSSLVDKINGVLNGRGITNGSANKDPKSMQIAPEIQTTDMKRLVDSLEQVKNRLNTLEKNQSDGKRGLPGRISSTKDISIDGYNSPTISIQEEMQPLLDISNDPESIIVLMKWIQYMVDRVGKIHLPDILSYYVDIGWISEDIRLDLIEYSKGIVEDRTSTEPIRRDSYNLPTKDHIQSFLFIQKLKGRQFDERFMSKIDREMEKIAKSLNMYQFK
ncbi:MAG: hypothetical protein NT038_05160 [Euryarchaeota archaeon]|nr:hypothetical protein [Euryarchaeota archaeon]